jgi:hypothetical protein
MKRIDLRRDFRDLYRPSALEIEMVRIPKLQYLMIDGEGSPNSGEGFPQAVQALYVTAYTLKFMLKNEMKVDFPVMALEGLWWAKHPEAFRLKRWDDWRWTLMIMQPGLVTKTHLKKALTLAFEKKGLPELRRVRLESFTEGLALQLMHVGPYDKEGPAIDRLHSFAAERKLKLVGKHHEIYLSDPRRVNPAKMKTILRHPVRK